MNTREDLSPMTFNKRVGEIPNVTLVLQGFKTELYTPGVPGSET